ncbi:hypothetical protein K440DRAFT_81113 [Wilcoxina mikolae CBS 423.85]|nr:hypothetical protein K440DRAFT_81113 [Wilcoxina mikolae CBS 423.85]
MSFGFAIGDFIAAGQLVANVIGALNSSTGSSEDYQELLSELYSYQRALIEAEQICSIPSCSSQFHVATINAIAYSVSLSRKPIEIFLSKIKRYRGRLKNSSWRKIGWALFKEDEVRELRDVLRMHIDCISLLVVTAGAKSSLRIESRQQENQSAIIGTIAVQRAELENLSIDILRQLQINIMSKNIGYSWEWSGEAPIRFEDALGRRLLLPLQLVGTWDVFKAILRARFKEFPGERRVQSGQYRILDSSNECKSLDKASWVTSALPGMDVFMSMVVERNISCKQEYECPRSDCRELNMALEGATGVNW